MTSESTNSVKDFIIINNTNTTIKTTMKNTRSFLYLFRATSVFAPLPRLLNISDRLSARVSDTIRMKGEITTNKIIKNHSKVIPYLSVP